MITEINTTVYYEVCSVFVAAAIDSNGYDNKVAADNIEISYMTKNKLQVV